MDVYKGFKNTDEFMNRCSLRSMKEREYGRVCTLRSGCEPAHNENKMMTSVVLRSFRVGGCPQVYDPRKRVRLRDCRCDVIVILKNDRREMVACEVERGPI